MASEKQNSSLNLTEALSKAESIIVSAEERAADLISAAKAEVEKIRHEAHQSGIDMARQEVTDLAVRLIEESGNVNQRLSAEAARLAVAISSAVIGEHVKVDPETVKKIAKRALSETVTGSQITILCNPEDEKTLKASMKEFSQLASGVALELQQSSMITAGGCLLKTDFGEVDAQIETLVAAVSKRLGISSGKG